MRSPSALVFDLDGTLSNPAQGIARSINYALVAYGYPPIAESTTSQYIGPPLDETFRALTGTDSAERLNDLVAAYRERYADVGFAENVLYPGIPEALDALSARGCVLGVCTSKRVDFAERILQRFGLRSYFAFVDGGEIGVRKSHQLRSLLANRSIGPGSIMIGDRSVDIAAAKSNGMRSVGVLWGHGSIEELRSAGADTLLSCAAELEVVGSSNAA